MNRVVLALCGLVLIAASLASLRQDSRPDPVGQECHSTPDTIWCHEIYEHSVPCDLATK